MTIYYNTVPTNLKVGGKAVNRMVVRHNGKISEATFNSRVARRCGYDDSVVCCVNNGVESQLIEEAANGNRVDFGWGYLYLKAKGSSSSIHDPWDSKKNHVESAVMLKEEVKMCLKDADMVNVTNGAKVIILHVADSEAMIDGVVSGTHDVDVRMTGNGLGVNPSAVDEGVWLENDEGIIQAVATVTEATTTTLACRFDTLPADGSYTLVVASRGGLGSDYGVAMGRRKVTVCAVAGE